MRKPVCTRGHLPHRSTAEEYGRVLGLLKATHCGKLEGYEEMGWLRELGTTTCAHYPDESVEYTTWVFKPDEDAPCSTPSGT